MNRSLIAQTTVTIHVPADQVWDALINPDIIPKYMFGTQVVSDWNKGSPIVWKGVWEGKPYEDKGTILKMETEHRLQYSHFSPLSGQSDVPENYHTVTIDLVENRETTNVTISQDNNATEDERQHSEQNWKMMLEALKKHLESNAPAGKS